MKIIDPETKASAIKNPFLRPKPGVLLADDFAIDRLLERGVVFGACNMALHVQSKMLAGNAGVALSRDWLLQRVWGFDFSGDERTIDVHVHRLRAKIEEPWQLPPLVRTVHGFGYKFIRG